MGETTQGRTGKWAKRLRGETTRGKRESERNNSGSNGKVVEMTRIHIIEYKACSFIEKCYVENI